MPEPVILAAVRTPFGKRGGAFRDHRPDALLAHALRGLVARAGVPAERVEDVICGTRHPGGRAGCQRRAARRAARGVPGDGTRGLAQPHVRLQPAGRPLRRAGDRRGRRALRDRLRGGEHDARAHVLRHRSGRPARRLRRAEPRALQTARDHPPGRERRAHRREVAALARSAGRVRDREPRPRLADARERRQPRDPPDPGRGRGGRRDRTHPRRGRPRADRSGQDGDAQDRVPRERRDHRRELEPDLRRGRPPCSSPTARPRRRTA